MNKAFIDTNIAIAFVFYINSLHFKANNVFDSYSDFFWSNFVKNEFNGRFSEKYIHLLNFYHDFQKYLETPNKELYSIFDLNKFVKENYLDKNLKDAISSLEPFWEYYVGVESQVPFIKMQNNIKKCLKDLKVDHLQIKGI